mgnify:FL=1
MEVMRRYALACVLCFNSEHFFVNNLTALFYNSIIFFTLVVTVYEGRCWPINKYFDPVSCSADERAADGMEAMLTRKGESVGLGECKRWFWNNSPLKYGSVIPVVNVQFDVNDRIIIVDGLFKGMEGFISDVNRSNRRINFEVTLMDGKRILSLSYQEIQKK